ncbi:MAG: (2Fe-2S)-binding protein, partial [Rhodanobacter sp.]
MAQVQAQILPTSQAGNIVPEPVREGIDLHINGEHYRHTGDPQMPLLWYLRDMLRLTGTKYAGAHGENGADLVLVADKAVSAITLSMSSLAD